MPKAKKTTSYFDVVTEAPTQPVDDSFFPSKYEYKEDWGEKFTGVTELGLYVLNVDNGKVVRVPDVPLDVTVGQPIFSPCGR